MTNLDIRINLRFFTATGAWCITRVETGPGDSLPRFHALKVWNRPGCEGSEEEMECEIFDLDVCDFVDRWR
jgi:hypothetical protein